MFKIVLNSLEMVCDEPAPESTSLSVACQSPHLPIRQIDRRTGHMPARVTVLE